MIVQDRSYGQGSELAVEERIISVYDNKYLDFTYRFETQDELQNTRLIGLYTGYVHLKGVRESQERAGSMDRWAYLEGTQQQRVSPAVSPANCYRSTEKLSAMRTIKKLS